MITNKPRAVLALSLLVALSAGAVLAQRSRTMSDSSDASAAQQTSSTMARPMPAQSPAPQTFRAKYEGGIFGYNRKIDGTLTFDDSNRRLLFRDRRGQELLHIPYDAIVAAFADTQSRRPTAASVIGSASIYTLPALLIRRRYRYLTLQYRDPDTQVSGITSFKVDSRELLNSVLYTLAQKAGLTPRGEVFVRLGGGATRARGQWSVPTPGSSPTPTPTPN